MTQRSVAIEPASDKRADGSARLMPRALMGWAALSLPAIALLLLRLPSLFEPRWNADEGVFAAVASRLLHGQVLYVDAWDNKPPMIFLTYAAVRFAFGGGVFPIHAVATAVALATLIVVMALAARLYGRTRAFVAGAVFAAIAGTPLFEANLALSEIFMILPVAVAMLVAVAAMDRPQSVQWKSYLIAGALLGIAANYKQVAVFDAAALTLMIGRSPGRPVRSVAALGIGFALPHVVALIAFSATGALGDYWFAIAGSLRSYSQSAEQFGGSNSFSSRAVNYLPALIAVPYALLIKDRSRAVAALPAVWLGFAFAGALSSPFAFPHYLIQVAPPFALVVAGIELPKRSVGAVGPILVVALAIALGVHTFGQVIRDRTQTHPRWYYEGFASRVRGDVTPRQYGDRFDGSVITIRDVLAAIDKDGGGESLFAWAHLPWLYAAGDFSSPSRYSTDWLGTWVPNARQEIAGDVSAHPPDYLVISQNVPEFPAMQDLADRRYTLVAHQGDWWLYRRTDLRAMPP
jgi:4-amino-4-deoxy-L-arabinose transferase-like glycosyltransferase